MLIALSVILLCQLAGEAFVRALGLPLPGPVMGMAIMTVVLLLRDRLPQSVGKMHLSTIEPNASALLAHLSLMFVPAGVGVVRSLDVFAQYGVRLIIALALSTLLTLVVSVGAFRVVAVLMGEGQTEDQP
jgi:putative effector of murein hydrolase LrgA (UPF0299 family)